MTGKQATQGENMKGDFSKWEFNPLDNYSSVLQQQGRALLDQDWNASSRINQHHRQMLGQDAIGEHVAAIPVDDRDSFRVSAASTDGASVTLTLNNGRAWIDGRLHDHRRNGGKRWEREACLLGLLLLLALFL